MSVFVLIPGAGGSALGHPVALAYPAELADQLTGYLPDRPHRPPAINA